MSLSVETSSLAHTNVLLTSLSSITSSSHSHTMPPKPLPEHTVKIHSSNAKKRPGEANYSADEDGILHPSKTPKTRKGRKPKVIKDAVSAEDTEANIKRLATYERQSLDNNINDVTPCPVFTPAPSIRQYIIPVNHSDPLISSDPNNTLEEEKSGLMTNNQPYIPLVGSNSETDTLTDKDDDSIHPPMAKVVAGRLKGIHDAGVKVVGQRGNTTKSNGGPAHLLPAKAVHKTIGAKELNDDGQASLKGKGKAKVIPPRKDSTTEDDVDASTAAAPKARPKPGLTLAIPPQVAANLVTEDVAMGPSGQPKTQLMPMAPIKVVIDSATEDDDSNIVTRAPPIGKSAVLASKPHVEPKTEDSSTESDVEAVSKVRAKPTPVSKASTGASGPE